MRWHSPGICRKSIHPTSKKGSSRQFIFTILHSPIPMRAKNSLFSTPQLVAKHKIWQ
jgi:hypothetical protein